MSDDDPIVCIHCLSQKLSANDPPEWIKDHWEQALWCSDCDKIEFYIIPENLVDEEMR